MRTKTIIHTPNNFAKYNLIYLQEVGINQSNYSHTKYRNNLKSFLFFTVLDGQGTLEIDHKIYQLKKDDFVFINCQQEYIQKTNNWTIQWVHFDGPTMNNIYEKYIERGGKFVFQSVQNKKKYNEILQNIMNIVQSQDYIKDMHLCEQLTSLLVLLMQDSWDAGQKKINSSSKRNAQDIREYIDNHYQEHITLTKISRKFYIDKYYLSRIFKQQFNQTVTSYINLVRITKAKRLLRFTNHSISNIAQQVGIADTNYFTRMFKKSENMTPSEYRNNW